MSLAPQAVVSDPARRAPVGGGARGRRRPVRSRVVPYVLIGPAILLVSVFAAYPLLRSIWLAFNDIDPLARTSSFVGFDNLIEAVTDAGFPALMGRTGAWVFGVVILQLLGGLGVALLLNTRFPLRGVYRGLVMVPWATPSVLVALMWKWILEPNHGVLNKVLQGLGLASQPVEFLSSSQLALPTLILVDMWQGIPLFAVMILAALQAVSADLKEAAALDGCGHWGAFRHVTLPAILPTILITTVLRLIWTANYIDLILILTGGGPGESSTTLALESYLTAYKATNFGLGAAYSLIQACILAVFVVIYMRLSGKGNAR